MLALMLTRQLHDDFPTELLSLLTRLKYPHWIPANSFESPNFKMMSGILCWLVKILDPTITNENFFLSESDRANLLNGIVSELATRFDIYLDTRQLYSADDRAVSELIKVARFIEKALQVAEELSSSPEEHFQVKNTIEATKRARSLVDEVTEICSRLSDLLENESDDRKDRTNALRFLNSILGNNMSARDHCNLTISRNLEVTNAAIERLDRQCKLLISSQRGTEEKILKKSIDLERSSKRLENLKEVRPAYMDEYEKLEKNLEVEYERYVVRLRNKDYLVGELSFFNQVAKEMRTKSERSVRRMQKKFRDDELRVLNGWNESEVTSM